MRRIAETAAAVDDAERAMVEEPPLEDARAVCRTCGYAARSDSPQQCPVCGGEAAGFERLDSDALRVAASGEGDATQTAFDGAKLGWTVEARRVLQQLPAGYLRRRVKAIVEKHARTRRLPAITAEVAEPFVAPELDALDENAGPHRAPIGVERHTGPQVDQRRRLPWTDEADDRIERIPAGFLRNLAIERIERLAIALGAPQVGVLHVEAGIAEARARMQRDGGASADADSAGCPVSAEQSGGVAGCPVHRDPSLRTNATLTGVTRRGGGLNEITAPVVDDLGRRMTAPLPGG
jgi:hypothetical protein